MLRSLLLLACLVYAHALPIVSTLDPSQLPFAVIFDCGSTGSRMFIYQYNTSPLVILPVKSNNTQFSVKKSPGISDIHPENVESYLKPMLDEAKQHIPASLVSKTPVYLKATAGLRLLPHPEPLLEAIRHYLKTKSGFKFTSPHQVAIISGEHEGVYSWLTVNYLLGNYLVPAKGQGNATMMATTMDLGGASAQLTFEPKEIPLSHHYTVMMNQEPFEVYTHSHLGLGANVARKRQIEALMPTQTASPSPSHLPVQDPCSPNGYTAVRQGANYSLSFAVTGKWNYQECSDLIVKKLFSLNTYCSVHPCSGVNAVYQAAIPPESPIYVISSFAYTAAFFNVSSISSTSTDQPAPKTHTLEDLENAAKKLCDATQFDQFKTLFPHANPEFLGDYCFNAAYEVALVEKGFHIAKTRPLFFTNDIHTHRIMTHINTTVAYPHQTEKVEISWTMGALLYEAGAASLKN